MYVNIGAGNKVKRRGAICMKSKKLFLPSIILLSAIAVMCVFGLLDAIVREPVTREAEFPFSITYELDGKTETIEDRIVCTYAGVGGYADVKTRHYLGEIVDAEETEVPGDYILYKDEDSIIALNTGLYADYLMGDPSNTHYRTECEPYLAYEDTQGNYEEGLELSVHHAKIVSWDYPEPIKNSFEFSHMTVLSGRSVIPMTIIALLAIVASIIFVKKEQRLRYTWVDKVSIVCNFLIMLCIVPFFIIVGVLMDIEGVAEDLLGQMYYLSPAIMTLGVAASICLRRKGYRKSGLLVQLIVIVLYIGIVIIL